MKSDHGAPGGAPADAMGGLQHGISIATQNSAAAYRLTAQLREETLMLAGRQACWAMPRNRPVADLSEVEFKVFSQWGEDGIIEWLTAHIELPNRRFVEFGVENFEEANCRFLTLNRNWRGLIMDGSKENMDHVRSSSLYWKHNITALHQFITVENINTLITNAGFAGPLGILSIDIDGNDYWIWEATTAVNPAIISCEYNAILGDTQPISVPYDAAFRAGTVHHGHYQGCSIAALRHLAERRGYEFVGTNSNGINAFFVRKDLAPPVLSLVRNRRAFPSTVRDPRPNQNGPGYVGGAARLSLIRDLPVVNVVTGRSLAIGEIEKPYSETWLKEMD